MRDVLSAEWLKIRTTASTRYVVLAVVVTALLGVLLAYLWGRTWDGMSPESRTRLTDGSIEETLAPLLQLILAVLGVLVVTSEYATGLIRTSLTVAPRRLVVLASKVGVVGVIALVSGVVVTFTTYLVSHGILGRRGFPGYAATFQDELPDLLQASAVVMVVALVGVGIGTVLRSTAGAMFVMAALLFIVPVFVGFLPAPWDDRIGSLMLPQLSDPLIAAGYVIAALTAASTMLLRRDV